LIIEFKQGNDWKDLNFTKLSKYRKDHSYYSSDSIRIFVYGYPFYEKKDSWVSAENLFFDYQELGIKFINSIDGVFTIVICDNLQQKIFIFSDVNKIYSLYYYLSEKQFIISTSVKNIKEKISELKPDKSAIMEFINFGFVLGNKTIFATVNKFDAGRIYSFNKHFKLENKQYWKVSVTEKYTKEDYLEKFNAHLQKGIRLSEKISLPLTAGLDSRTIISGVLQNRSKIICYTHGPKTSQDVITARKICRKFNIAHLYYGVNNSESDFIKNFNFLNDNFEGMLNTTLFTHLIGSYSDQSNHASTLFNGNGGELLRDYYNYNNFGAAEDEGNFLALRLRRSTQIQDYKIFCASNINELLKLSVLNELKNINCDNTYKLFNLFYHYNRFSNFSGYSLKLAGNYLQVFLPFLSKDLINILYGINFTDIPANEFQSFIIRTNCSELTQFLVNDYSISNHWTPSIITSLMCIGAKKISQKIESRIFRSKQYNSLPNIRFISGENGLLNQTFSSPTEILSELIDFDYLQDYLKRTRINYPLYYFLTNLITVDKFLKHQG
jgi:hypothetical protein